MYAITELALKANVTYDSSKVKVVKLAWLEECVKQKIYISDIERISNLLGWEPKVSVNDGVKNLFEWTRENIRDV